MASHITANHLLAMLPDAERGEILANCVEVSLVFGETLVEPGEELRHVYFPLEGFISLITLMNGKPILETGLIGAEGMLGATLALGVGSSPSRAMVQGAGTAWRMDADVFQKVVCTCSEFRRLVLRYLYVMIEQLVRTPACTQRHIIAFRLARWLLMTRDRAQSNDFPVTQKFLSYMLGVRREGVTEAAGDLQRRGVIHYNRGHMEIIDLQTLEGIACSCYASDKQTHEQIMGV